MQLQHAPKEICYFWFPFPPSFTKPSFTNLTMHAASQTAFHALRDYLNSLLSPTHPDQALDEIPAALRPSLEVFMRGKTEYQDETGRRMIYAYDLAAWASDLIYGAGLPAPLPLASLNVAELRAATLPQVA